jgi:SAM-dependent methyltransferase
VDLWQKFFGRRTGAIAVAAVPAGACPFCRAPVGPDDRKCGGCGSAPRHRSLSAVLPSALGAAPGHPSRPPLLAFSAFPQEKAALAPYFSSTVSVSLHGRYGDQHTSGIDARDLSRFPDGVFGGHYSCCALFDYFLEHEQALAEAHRVLAPGGVLLTHIIPPRLQEGDMAPVEKAVIRPGPGYYEYVPEDQPMLSVRVGAAWFQRAMTRAGFRATRYRVADPAGVVCDWFLGHKAGP